MKNHGPNLVFRWAYLMECVGAVQLNKPLDNRLGLFLPIDGNVPVVERIQPDEPLIDQQLWV